MVSSLTNHSKKKIHKFQPCLICSSPARFQIERDLREHVHVTPKIAERYAKFFPMASKLSSVLRKIYRHRKHMDLPECKAFKPVTINTQIFTDRDELKNVKPVTLESFAQRMLEIGDKSLDFYEKNPIKLPLKVLASTQKLLIEKQKVNVQKTALELSMSKLFGGFLPKDKAVEGEIIDDGADGPAVQPLPAPRVIQSGNKK